MHEQCLCTVGLFWLALLLQHSLVLVNATCAALVAATQQTTNPAHAVMLLTCCVQIVFLLREVYRGFSARADRQVLPGGDKGLMRNTAHLHFTRWDRIKPPTVDNLVLLSAEEAEQHDARSLEQLKQSEPELVEKVERLIDMVRAQVLY